MQKSIDSDMEQINAMMSKKNNEITQQQKLWRPDVGVAISMRDWPVFFL